MRRYQNFYPTEGYSSVIFEEDSNENAIAHFESNIRTFQKGVMSCNDFCDAILM